MTGMLAWQPPHDLPVGMRWSARSRTLVYSAAGRSWRLVAPVLAVETAPWLGLDGRVRFGLHRAGAVDLYAAAVELACVADPFAASRAAGWQATTRQACWQTAAVVFERGAVIQGSLDALDLEPDERGGRAMADRRAGRLGVWAVVTAAVALGEQSKP
jgi:hypothetical protein